jgi:hypothetical protein
MNDFASTPNPVWGTNEPIRNKGRRHPSISSLGGTCHAEWSLDTRIEEVEKRGRNSNDEDASFPPIDDERMMPGSRILRSKDTQEPMNLEQVGRKIQVANTPLQSLATKCGKMLVRKCSSPSLQAGNTPWLFWSLTASSRHRQIETRSAQEIPSNLADHKTGLVQMLVIGKKDIRV